MYRNHPSLLIMAKFDTKNYNIAPLCQISALSMYMQISNQISHSNLSKKYSNQYAKFQSSKATK